MNPASQPSRPLRRVARWLLIITGLCLAPFAILALVAISYVSLDSDSAALRRQIMSATGPGWATKVQLNVGPVTIGAANLGLRFVKDRNIEDARFALSAVSHASVGVYERTSAFGSWSRGKLLATTDLAMGQRGWTRLVGVVDEKETVIIYAPQDLTTGKSLEVCLAVINDKQLVVAATKVNASALEELIRLHASGEAKARWLPKEFLAGN
jgi:hypothetical protein